MLHFGQQHDELVAALPADGVGARTHSHQAFGDGLQQLVADRMAERIVDVLEAIQIEEQHRDLLAVARRQGDRLADAVVQQHAVGQAGQEVVLGRMGHLQRHRPGRADIAKHDHRADDLPCAIVDWRHRILDRNFGAVAPDRGCSSTAGASS